MNRTAGERHGDIRIRYEPYLYLLPLVLFTSAFIILPVLGTFASSLMRDVAYMGRKFVFLENYSYLLGDKSFWASLRFTVVFSAVTVALEIILGLLVSLLLDQPSPLRGLLRTCVLLPWAIPSVIAARIWELFYNYHDGLANRLVGLIPAIDRPINWFGSDLTAFLALAVADIWKTTPFVAIILLSGLQSIPADLYAQGRIDGADRWQRFAKITLPLLKPFIVIALLFRTIDSLRIFDLVYVLTHGGPGGATTSISLYAYKYFIAGDFGYASAVSVVLFAVAFGLSLAYVRLSRFREALT